MTELLLERNKVGERERKCWRGRYLHTNSISVAAQLRSFLDFFSLGKSQCCCLLQSICAVLGRGYLAPARQINTWSSVAILSTVRLLLSASFGCTSWCNKSYCIFLPTVPYFSILRKHKEENKTSVPYVLNIFRLCIKKFSLFLFYSWYVCLNRNYCN